MRNIFLLLIVTLSMSGSASSEVNAPAIQHKAVEEFSRRVKAYIRLRKNVENSFTRVGSFKNSADIAAHKIELAGLIAAARSGASQGDIFTAELAAQFRDVIRKTIQASDGQAIRRTLQDKDVDLAVSTIVRVNAVYPEGNPLQTASPTLLAHLPDLPNDLAYRIIDRSFVLLDNKTRLIVDFIPDALP